jgi:hypothetical protein
LVVATEESRPNLVQLFLKANSVSEAVPFAPNRLYTWQYANRDIRWGLSGSSSIIGRFGRVKQSVSLEHLGGESISRKPEFQIIMDN